MKKTGYAFVYSRVGVGETDNIIGSLSTNDVMSIVLIQKALVPGESIITCPVLSWRLLDNSSACGFDFNLIIPKKVVKFPNKQA